MPAGRRWVALALAVFAAGIGVGALIVALGGGGSGPPARAVSAADPGARRRSAGGSATRAHHRPRSRPGAQPGSRPRGPAGSQTGHTGSRTGGAAVAGGGVVPAGARASFDALAATLPGRVGMAVAPLGEGPVTLLGQLQAGHAWSTMKVPVLATLMADDERTGQALSAAERQDAQLGLEQSDNAAAEALFGELEAGHGGLVGASQAVQATLARAGDTATVVNTAPNDQGFTTWGQSIWSNSGEVAFYRALAEGCLLSRSDTGYVLGLMENVISAQRWGAGAAGYPPGLALAFKAGWGPEATGGYLVRQSAIVGSGNRGYVMSLLALPASGSFTDGVSLIDALARWARGHLVLAPAPGRSCPAR